MSREAAFSYILPRIEPGWRILDIGAGESPFAVQILRKGCAIVAVDHDAGRLERGWIHADRKIDCVVGDIREVEIPGRFDCVTAVYSLQHMIGFEPAIWVKIRGWLKDGGTCLVMARYRDESPRYEGSRGDPLLSQDLATIRALAGLTNFSVMDAQLYEYDGPGFREVPSPTPKTNAVGFRLKAIRL
jgi:hypothetical protein